MEPAKAWKESPEGAPVDLEIRPKFGSFVGQYGTRLAGGGTLVALGLVIEAYRLATSPHSLKVTAAGVVALAALLLLIAAVYGVRARITVAGDSIVQRGWKTRRFHRGDIATAVTCRTGLNRTNRLLAVKGKHNECLLCVYADYWSDNDLNGLLLRLGQPAGDQYQAECSAGALRRQFPGGGLPFVVAHPGWSGLLATPFVFAVVVLIVQLFS